MTTIILIRHGESEANKHGVFAGHTDADLQPKGLAQAKTTAKYIADNYNVDKIYASDLKRAYKTAMCLGEILDLEVIAEEGLREINAGEWEGIEFDKLLLSYPDEYGKWINDIGASVCNGGESVEQLGERIMSALTKIAKENEGKTVAIATHATPIRVAQTLIKTGALKEMKNIPWVTNASVTVFEYSSGVWSIKAESIDEHLGELKSALPKNV
ncbi:MAG: histidine phosphatase family protein [Clostridia bacterium]|nr:histidine phosphatase family protein [Clostridia bacterium]